MLRQSNGIPAALYILLRQKIHEMPCSGVRATTFHIASSHMSSHSQAHRIVKTVFAAFIALLSSNVWRQPQALPFPYQPFSSAGRGRWIGKPPATRAGRHLYRAAMTLSTQTPPNISPFVLVTEKKAKVRMYMVGNGMEKGTARVPAWLECAHEARLGILGRATK